MCQSLFFNKVAGLRPQACNFIKKEALAQVFSCEICKISKNTFFTEHLWATVFVQMNHIHTSKEVNKITNMKLQITKIQNRKEYIKPYIRIYQHYLGYASVTLTKRK